MRQTRSKLPQRDASSQAPGREPEPGVDPESQCRPGGAWSGEIMPRVAAQP